MENRVLENLFLWQGIRKETVEKYLSALPLPMVFEKGTVIYKEQEFPRALAVILEGKLTVCSHSGATVRTLSAGDVFGVTALFDCAQYASTITALSRVKLQFIQEEQLQKWMEETPAVSMNYIRFLHQRIRYLNQKIRLYTEDSVEQRLMGYIKSHATQNGEILLGSIASLARELNIGRTSLYRTLEQLEAKGKIAKRNRKWFLEEQL